MFTRTVSDGYLLVSAPLVLAPPNHSDHTFLPDLLRHTLSATLVMADHQSEIHAFGSNDDFWLFGYG